MRRVAGLAISGLMVAVASSGCGRSVAVDPLPVTSDATRPACANLIGELPARISVGRSWNVTPDPESTMAWGSPPVVLRCGDQVPLPAPTDQLLTIDGLSWLVTPLTQGQEYTTVERAPGVVVTVPEVFQPSASVLAELSAVVLRETQPAPSPGSPKAGPPA